MKKITGLLLASLINKERKNLNLPLIKYNDTLHDYLKSNNTFNGEYLYDSGPNYKSWVIENVTRYTDINGVFERPFGHNYMFRDTMKDSIVKIFRYRIAQKGCKSTQFFDGDRCSWFYAYYPVMMQNYTSFACKILDYPGRFLPPNLIGIQKKSWWCFFDSTVYYWK